MRPSLNQIRRLPKADLHSHIDGSISLRDLFQIAKRHRRKILTPSGSELGSISAFMRYVVGEGYDSMLDNIVERFYPITGLIQTEGSIRDVGVAYVKAQKDDGVAYAEGRFAPQYHTREGLSLKSVIESMAEGLAEGSERYGVKTALIVGIGRETLPHLGSEVARAAAGSGLAVALDLCGPEKGNPPLRFKEAFRIAADAGMKVTVHAGEGAGSTRKNMTNMEDAISGLGANRLGHAIPLARSQGLVNLALEKKVAIEMNPVSNLVLHNIEDLKELSIDKLLDQGVMVSINSDDPSLWPHGHLQDVYFRVCRSYGFGYEELDTLMRNSFAGSFAVKKDKDWLAESYEQAIKDEGLGTKLLSV